MFDLDSAITEWRRQMLAGGIKSAVLLDELGCHLRDDVEAQVESGSDAQQAFEIAARRMGPPITLKSEFQKNKSNELMKLKIRNLLVIIAVMATGAALVLPAIAKSRAHETFAPLNLALFLIGVAIFAYGAVCGARGIFETLKKHERVLGGDS